MTSDKSEAGKLDRVLAEQRDYIVQREKGYREKALKLYPWICGRCGREFTRANLDQLTVHHIDHNHDNNPPDGSNWELLCIYCHDEEHAKYLNSDQYGNEADRINPPATFRPFADLKEKLKKGE